MKISKLKRQLNDPSSSTCYIVENLDPEDNIYFNIMAKWDSNVITATRIKYGFFAACYDKVNNDLSIGFSFCSSKDLLDHKLGIDLAKKRAKESQSVYSLPFEGVNHPEKLLKTARHLFALSYIITKIKKVKSTKCCTISCNNHSCCQGIH